MNYTHHDQPYAVRLQPNADGSFIAHIDGQQITVHITPGADDSLLIRMEDDTAYVVAVAQDDSRYIHHDGHAYTLTAQTSTATARRARSTGDGGTLTAQMPGQVVDVFVAPGDAVAAHQPLLVLEAMKMEIRITAPHAGTVQAVHTARGAVVERGQTLIEIAPASDL